MNLLEIVSIIILCVSLALLCYLVVRLVEQEPSRRIERETRPSHVEPVEDAFSRIDRLFDTGALLVTVLSAAELQYATVKRLSEITFVFRVLTIPIIILIILWLIKDSFPHLFMRLLIRQFCWSFFGFVLGLELLIFAMLGFYMPLAQVISLAFLLVIACDLLSVGIILEYVRRLPEIRLLGSRWLASVPTFLVGVFAYYTLLWVIQVSNLPGP